MAVDFEELQRLYDAYITSANAKDRARSQMQSARTRVQNGHGSPETYQRKLAAYHEAVSQQQQARTAFETVYRPVRDNLSNVQVAYMRTFNSAIGPVALLRKALSWTPELEQEQNNQFVTYYRRLAPEAHWELVDMEALRSPTISDFIRTHVTQAVDAYQERLRAGTFPEAEVRALILKRGRFIPTLIEDISQYLTEDPHAVTP